VDCERLGQEQPEMGELSRGQLDGGADKDDIRLDGLRPGIA